MAEYRTPMQIKEALLKGNAQKIQDQHAKGKLTARERIAEVLDEGSFMETNVFLRGIGTEQIAESVITGYGTVDGRPVYVYAQDYTAMSGALGTGQAKKIVNVYESALKNGVPVLAIFDTAGARIQEGMAALDGYARIYKCSADASGVIPQIALVCGPCPGAAAFATALCDITVITEKNGAVFGRGPQVISAAEGRTISAEELGGAKTSMESGVAQVCAGDEHEGIAKVRQLLSMLPSNNLEDVPSEDCEDDLNRETLALNAYVPGQTDMHDVLQAIADSGSVFELTEKRAPNMLTALARINGRTIGILGNNAAVHEGVLCGKAAEKAARFVRFCDSFNLPLILLIDSVGLPTSLKAEQDGLIQKGSKLIFALAESTVAKVALIAGKATGSAYAMMAAKSLGLDLVYAWPQASVCALEPEAAVSLLWEDRISEAEDPVAARAELAAEYAADQGGALRAAELGLVDDVIEPALSRPVVASALELLWGKREDRIPRKHGSSNV